MPELVLWLFDDDSLDHTIRVVGEAPKGLNMRKFNPAMIPPARLEIEADTGDGEEWLTLSEYVEWQMGDA